jgi:hypothetical protein
MSAETKIIVALIVILAAAVPVCGEMTDYERGVANGLKIGFFMGELYGKGQYADDPAKQFNGYLEEFYRFLVTSFGNNQTLITEFMKSPLPVKSTASTGGVPAPDSSGRIYGYPADAYYTAVGAGPGDVPDNPRSGMGWI